MSAIDIIKDILKEYKYKISTHRYGFLGLCKSTKIQLDVELFISVVESLNNKFGIPVYIHSYYGLIWNKNGEFISCNIIEEPYGNDCMDVFLFDKIPHGKKLPYKEYKSIDGTIKQVFDKFCFNCDTSVNYYPNGFTYIVSNENTQWLLQLNDKTMACYFSDIRAIDSVTTIVPRYICKKSINLKDPLTIKHAMEQSFSEYSESELKI